MVGRSFAACLMEGHDIHTPYSISYTVNIFSAQLPGTRVVPDTCTASITSTHVSAYVYLEGTIYQLCRTAELYRSNLLKDLFVMSFQVYGSKWASHILVYWTQKCLYDEVFLVRIPQN